MTDETKTVADVKAAIADVELEFTKVKLFWAKYGHPALYTAVSAISAFIGHVL